MIKITKAIVIKEHDTRTIFGFTWKDNTTTRTELQTVGNTSKRLWDELTKLGDDLMQLFEEEKEQETQETQAIARITKLPKTGA